MTVKELISILNEINENRIVLISKDSEGNGFSVLNRFETAAYDSYRGEIGLEKLTELDISAGYSEDDVVDGVPVVVFWP